jgi:hypothetical protein
MGVLLNAAIACLIPGSTVVVILRFFVGKPPSYFPDWLSQQLGRNAPLISAPRNGTI